MSKMTVTSSSDLTYGNCMALNAPAIFDEAYEWLVVKSENEDKELYKAMFWAVNEATEEELNLIGQFVLQDDHLWNIWRTSVIASIQEYYVTKVTPNDVVEKTDA